MKQLEDGIAIRNRVVDMLEQASTTADAAQRASMLTFVVVGGGATGVETAGALADLVQRVMPVDYPRLNAAEVRVVLVEAGPKLLGHMSSRTGRYCTSRAAQDEHRGEAPYQRHDR